MKFLSLFAAKIEDRLDAALDKLTTYRLVLYLLILYILAASVLGLVHKVPFQTGPILLSSLWLVVICRASNWFLASIFKVPRNHESDLITALILALIMSPASNLHSFLVLVATGFSAMLVKYAITWKGRHLFNPAASGAFIAGVLFNTYASWWIGTKFMLPLVAIGGLLIAKKMKRLQMVLVFGAVWASYIIAYAPAEHGPSTLWQVLINSSVIFFATVMLTEPLTSPSSLNQCLTYALVTGFLFSSRQLHLAPESALLIGNGLTFLMSPNRSVILKLIGSQKEAQEIYSFIFETKKRFNFAPGQYMEWTLPGVSLDARGNRRYLTIASSPTEPNLAFSVRIPAQKSGFKTALTTLKPGQNILAAQIAGDFTLPRDANEKLSFIAGGIGITPFRSMIKYLIDKKEHRDIQLVYSVSEPSQLAFRNLFHQAREIGLHSTFINSQALGASIDSKILAKAVPDFTSRTFYISGPQGFVAHIRETLLDMGLSPSKIVTDFFPGYN